MHAYPGEEWDDTLALEAQDDIDSATVRLAAAVAEMRAVIKDLNDSSHIPPIDAEAFDNFVHDEIGSEYLPDATKPTKRAAA